MKIVVNGREIEVTGLPLAHEVVVCLCLPIWTKTRSFREDKRVFTVTWRLGEERGTLAPGESIVPREAMAFNAAHLGGA